MLKENRKNWHQSTYGVNIFWITGGKCPCGSLLPLVVSVASKSTHSDYKKSEEYEDERENPVTSVGVDSYKLKKNKCQGSALGPSE